MKYKYFIEALGGSEEDAYGFYSEFENINRACRVLIVEDAARDYFDNHDGWEVKWPLTFTVMQIDGTIIGRFEIEREYIPSFRIIPFT